MKRLVFLFAMLMLVAPLGAIPEPTADELQANRRRFEQLRKQHPEVAAKLRADAVAFFALPKERRRQIVQIHKELHQESAAAQARLFNVLDRYVDWLEHLDKSDKPARKKIEEAKDTNERLAFVRELREQQWIKDQPKAIGEKIAGLKGDERKAFIAKEKEEEKQRRLEWMIASRFWNELESEQRRKTLPTKLGDLSQPVKYYVDNYLLKMFLSPEEKDQLTKLEGQWPQFPMKLVELADKHPAALPGPHGPKSLSELPTEILVKLKLFKKDAPIALGKKDVRLADKWPGFGSTLVKLAKQKGVTGFNHEFLAWDDDCLTAPMQEFMKKKLVPALTRDELQRLYDARGKWPDYPKTIQELANTHHLHVPWFILPRDANWDNYRLQPTASLDGFPEVPQGRLRDFALFELDAGQRAKLKLNVDDPDSKRRLAEEYFRSRPFELRKLRAADQDRRRAKDMMTNLSVEKGE